jgi:hypothetical protein
MNEWQYTNQFFEEGREHYEEGGSIKDCPYDYLSVEDNHVQTEMYRQQEWIAGFRYAHIGQLGPTNVVIEQKIA